MKWKKSNHPDQLNKVAWYNTAICSSLHGSLFEYSVTNELTNRYDLMCSIVAHDKKQPAYEYDEKIIGDRLMPKNMTIEGLEAFGATFNLIEIWLKLLDENYDAIRVT